MNVRPLLPALMPSKAAVMVGERANTVPRTAIPLMRLTLLLPNPVMKAFSPISSFFRT